MGRWQFWIVTSFLVLSALSISVMASARLTVDRGSFEHTLDAKGRLSIPAKFREVLLGKGDDRIVITNFVVDVARCLDVYPLDEWLRFEEEIRKNRSLIVAWLCSRTIIWGCLRARCG